MKSVNKILLVVLVILGVGLVSTAEKFLEATNEIDLLRAESERMSQSLAARDEEIDNLIIQVEQANAVIEAQAPIVEEFKQISRFIDLDAFETTQLENVKAISEQTPLDYEGALSLVKYADRFDIPYSLVLSIIDLESNFDREIVGADQDRGYMQIIPGTEKWLATEFGEELGLEYDPSRIFESEYNLALGIKYLDLLMDSYGSNYERILSEYNRGPTNLAKYYEAYKTYSTSYSRTVLSREKKYVALND
ncbi:lytic transglycosylase domain-containing protein [Fusibacter tunisiensis]|uniref:Soluble lytic murein transglycosylase-like protein n=1 Tax=Fusibacter tunisiensis TaxID=1008308 RepID=A0ABS2MPA5_9FIRM|nr:transglycosylase SLT domain-containing protein [Fusibacter tunisiensis]MBM7561234.1 soluble lytic murein transglycosylase-like protein [Fusibacter tunisiensis]